MDSFVMMQDKRRYLKFLICYVGGMIITMLIGYPNVMTISATGLLVINSDRGELGSRNYMLRRTLTNLLCAIIGGLLLGFGLNHIPIPSWIQVIVVGVIIVVVGIAIDAKHTIAPMALTIAMGALIVTTGTVTAPYYGARRVLLVVIGCVWGWLVDYVFLPRHPLDVAEQKLKVAAPIIQQSLSLFVQQSVFPDLSVLAPTEKDLALAQKDLGLLLANISHKKYQGKAEKIKKLHGLYRIQVESLALLKYLKTQEAEWEKQPESFRQEFAACLANLNDWEITYAQNLLQGQEKSLAPLSVPELKAENNEQILLQSKFLAYFKAIQALES